MTSEGGPEQPANGEGKDPKEGKRFFKFVFNVNKKCSDETEMTPEFVADVKHYYEYDDAVDKCHKYLEAIYAPAGTKAALRQNDEAFMRLSVALADFKQHVPSNYTSVFDTYSKVMEVMSAWRGSHLKCQSYPVDLLLNFHAVDFAKFAKQKKAFDESRRKMDVAKAEVREAKTTTAIEKKAICYQMAVDDFDQQTENLIKIIDALPATKKVYGHSVLTFLTTHKTYHEHISGLYASRTVPALPKINES